MKEVVTLAEIYLVTIAIGYFLVHLSIVGQEMKKSVSDLIFHVTLPGLLIGSFAKITVDFWFIFCIFLGIAVNILMIIVACMISARKDPGIKSVYTINGAGFNIGNLAIPFLVNFYPTGIPYLCMFDTGDSFLTMGTTMAIAKARMYHSKDVSNWELIKNIMKQLFSSYIFDLYVALTVLSILEIELPAFIIETSKFLGRGNGCLAMLLIGLSLNFRVSREQLREAIFVLLSRYFCGGIAAACVFYLLPAPLVMRRILSVAAFTGAPSAALIFTMKICKQKDVDIAGIVASLSAVCMIPMMVIVMSIVGI